MAGSESDGSVSSWRDQYGLRNATSVAARNTPSQTDDGGKKAIRFTRTNNEILRASAQTGVTTYTLFIVFKANETTNNQKLVGNGGASDTTHGFDVNIQTGNVRINNRNTNTQQQKSFAFTDTADYHVLTVKFQSVSTAALNTFNRTVFKLDNVVKITDGDAQPLLTSSASFDFGSDASNVSFDGYFREIICVSEWMSEANERKVYQYLNTKWGLSVTTTMPSYTFPGTISNNTGMPATATLGTASLYGDIFEYSNEENTKPVLIMMHGYSDTAGSLGADALTRIAGYGFMVLAVQMRGRGGSSGSRDSSGQEVYDIYDVYQNLLSKMSSYGIIDTDRVAMAGYSGGGGNSLNFACRFPDLCSVIVDHFGMSDYGYDGTNSWYFQDVSRQTQLDTDVGSPRTSFLNEYRVRNSREAVAKNFKGKLFIFHDASDTSVPILNSSNVKGQYVAEGRSVQESIYGVYDNSDLRYSITTSSDSPRWSHANPTGSAGIIQAEQYWYPSAESLTYPVLANSGTLRILGWVRTRSFYILLGNGTSASDGKVRCADLTYNVSSNSYTITPLLESGASDETVAITVLSGAHSGKTASGTISAETTFNPA